MSINPYILLGIGTVFGLLYAAVITFGWARTRANRRALQEVRGTQSVPVFDLETWQPMTGTHVKTFSLSNNTFVSADGTPVNPANYDVYIAAGRPDGHPHVAPGNLIMLDKTTHQLAHAFALPNLNHYR